MSDHSAHQQAQLERSSDVVGNSEDEKLASRWISEIKASKAIFERWTDRADTVIKRYRDEDMPSERRSEDDRRYNVFWSIVQTTKPHLFMEPPEPYVTRTFLDEDPAARDASMMLERVLHHEAREDEFIDAMNAAVDDFQLVGRGQTWVRYVAETEEREGAPVYGEEPTPDNAPEGFVPIEGEQPGFKPIEIVTLSERIELGHVPWTQFIHEPAARWEDVTWVGREEAMTREELIERFGEEIGNAVPMKRKQGVSKYGKELPDSDEYRQLFQRTPVFEIWDKKTRRVLWVCPDYPDRVLDIREDLYRLPDFFPCPRPLYATLTTDSLIPIPDYVVWQDLLRELDDLTRRIKMLTQVLRITGAYAADMPELKNIVNGGDNELYPAMNWAVMQEAGGLAGLVDFMPLDEIRSTLETLIQTRRELRQELFEISGIGDVIKGASDYRETAKAQQIKGEWASMRLRRMQHLVARHAVEILRIMAGLLRKQFSEAELVKMSSAAQAFTKLEQKPAPPPMPGAPPQPAEMQTVVDEERIRAALELIKGDDDFRIEIETETLAATRHEQQLQEAQNFLSAIGAYIGQVLPMAQEMPNAGPMLGQLLMYGVRRFKVGRSVEAKIEETIRQLLTQGTGKPPEQNGKSEGELELEKMKLQLEQQRLKLEEMKLQISAQQVQAKAQADFGRLQIDAQSRERDAQDRKDRQQADGLAKAMDIRVRKEGQELQNQTVRRGQDIKIAELGVEMREHAEDRRERMRSESADRTSAAMQRAADAEREMIENELDRVSQEAQTAAQLESAERQARDRGNQQGSEE